MVIHVQWGRIPRREGSGRPPYNFKSVHCVFESGNNSHDQEATRMTTEPFLASPASSYLVGQTLEPAGKPAILEDPTVYQT